MRQDLLKLQHLRNKVIDIEIKLAMIESDLLAVEKDLIFLEHLYVELRENLTILKKDGIITIASEYKKTITDLKSVIKNLSFYNDLHEKLSKDFLNNRERRDELLVEYNNFEKIVKDYQVVLDFDLSKRKK